MRLPYISLARIFTTIFGRAVPSNPDLRPALKTCVPKISALRPLISIGEVPAALQCWNSRCRFPLTRPRNANEQHAYDAIRFNRSLTFTYFGSDGSTQRTVDPIFIFNVEAFPGAYVTAYCQLRQEIRTFHLDRILFPPA